MAPVRIHAKKIMTKEARKLLLLPSDVAGVVDEVEITRQLGEDVYQICSRKLESCIYKSKAGDTWEMAPEPAPPELGGDGGSAPGDPATAAAAAPNPNPPPTPAPHLRLRRPA